MTSFGATTIAAATLLVLVCQLNYIDGRRRELSCLTFDKGFTAPPKYKTPIYHQNVQIIENNCVYGACAQFSGVSSSRLFIPPVILYGKKRYSLSFWFRFDGSSYNSGIVSGGECPRPYFKILAGLGNQVSVQFAGRSLGYFVAKDDWNHVVVSWDGRHARLYANGVPKGHFRMTRPFTGAKCPIYFSGIPYGSGHIGAFKGFVDQICFYDVGLRYWDVKLLYKNPCILNFVKR